MARQQGESLPVAACTLWKRMNERGLLASRDSARNRLTVRRRLGGRERREVVHLWADALSAPKPPQPSPATVSRGENGDSPGDGCTESEANRPQQQSPEPRQLCGADGPGDDGDVWDGRGAVYPPAGAQIISPSPSGSHYAGDGPYRERR